MENIIFRKGAKFYSPAEKTWFEITNGSITFDYNIFGVHNNWIEPKRLYVQKMKFEYDKTDLIPIDDLKNRKYYYQDTYLLVIDETTSQILYKDDVYLRLIFNEVYKYVDYKNIEDKHKNFNDKSCFKISTI